LAYGLLRCYTPRNDRLMNIPALLAMLARGLQVKKRADKPVVTGVMN